MEFDTFDTLNELIPQPFTFIPDRFELWQNQKMTKSGSTNGLIEATINNDKIFMTVNDKNLHSIINQKTEYDKLVCATDRLRFINIPQKTDVSCNGIETLLTVYGATRSIKIFAENEPYCCNIFLSAGRLAKLTFSYSNPVKLLEFYSSSINEIFKKNQIDESNYSDLISLSNSVLNENIKSKIISKSIEFCKDIIEKVTNKFTNNIIRRNLIQWQDDEFIQYLSFSVEIGTVSFIVKNDLLDQFKNSNELNVVVCLVNFSICSFLSKTFYEMGLKNNSSLFYSESDLSTLADRSYNLLFDEDIKEKIELLVDYYLD